MNKEGKQYVGENVNGSVPVYTTAGTLDAAAYNGVQLMLYFWIFYFKSTYKLLHWFKHKSEHPWHRKRLNKVYLLFEFRIQSSLPIPPPSQYRLPPNTAAYFKSQIGFILPPCNTAVSEYRWFFASPKNGGIGRDDCINTSFYRHFT